MFCNKCGVAVENNMRKCPQCGHFIKIDKKNISFEAINDIQYNSESNNNYDKNEYISSVKANENYYQNSYKNDLEKYRQIKESLASSTKTNTENTLKINWLVLFILFIISPAFAIIYFLIMTTINKANGKK